MDIEFHKGFTLSKFRQGDQPSLIEHINDYDVYKYTLAIPYPYTQKDADWWINYNLELYTKSKGEECWCIRYNDEVAGAIDITPAPFTPHRAEIGYWLGKKFWGQGVATAAVKKVLQLNQEKFGYTKLTAHIYEENLASQSVVKKNGFVLEAVLKNHYQKDGLIKNGQVYSLFL